jgi:hypothetical protein
MNNPTSMADNVAKVRAAILALNAKGNTRPSLSELQTYVWDRDRMVTTTLHDILDLMVGERTLIQFRPSMADAQRYRITSCYQLAPGLKA